VNGPEVSATPAPVLATGRQKHYQRCGGGIVPADLFTQLQAIADLMRVNHLHFIEIDQIMILSHESDLLLLNSVW
jgi:hypothetical protein